MRTARILSQVCILGALSSGSAHAQAPPDAMPGWWLVPTFRVAGVQQNNVELTDELRSVGSFLRVTSALEARFRNPRRIFQANYSLDSEKYPGRLRVLDNTLAQHMGGLRLESRPAGLLADIRFGSTTRPEEILESTGLVAAYRRTSSVTGTLGIDRAPAPRWRTGIRYLFSYADYGAPTVSRPTARTNQHGVSASLTRQMSPRTIVALEQNTRMLIGDDISVRALVRGTFWDGNVVLRLTHDLTPRVRATVSLGPRLSQQLPSVINPLGFTPLERRLSPEALASIQYRERGRAASVSYLRSAQLGFGAAGFVTTQSLEARLGLAGRRWRATTRPAAYRNSLPGLRAKSYRIDAGAAVDLTRWMALETMYTYRYQDRALSLADFGARSGVRPRTRSTVLFGVTFTSPMQLK